MDNQTKISAINAIKKLINLSPKNSLYASFWTEQELQELKNKVLELVESLVDEK